MGPSSVGSDFATREAPRRFGTARLFREDLRFHLVPIVLIFACCTYCSSHGFSSPRKKQPTVSVLRERTGRGIGKSIQEADLMNVTLSSKELILVS